MLAGQARCHHTATHLLQAALKLVVGDDISQAGSLVDFDRLRFDFNSAVTPSPAQLTRVEQLVNGPSLCAEVAAARPSLMHAPFCPQAGSATQWHCSPRPWA
jgi:hypothetical protein